MTATLARATKFERLSISRQQWLIGVVGFKVRRAVSIEGGNTMGVLRWLLEIQQLLAITLTIPQSL